MHGRKIFPDPFIQEWALSKMKPSNPFNSNIIFFTLDVTLIKNDSCPSTHQVALRLVILAYLRHAVLVGLPDLITEVPVTLDVRHVHVDHMS